MCLAVWRVHKWSTGLTFKKFRVQSSLKPSSELIPVTIKWRERVSSWITEEKGEALFLCLVILMVCLQACVVRCTWIIMVQGHRALSKGFLTSGPDFQTKALAFPQTHYVFSCLRTFALRVPSTSGALPQILQGWPLLIVQLSSEMSRTQRKISCSSSLHQPSALRSSPSLV